MYTDFHIPACFGIIIPMAYDETLAQRLDSILKSKRGISQKKMFGGVAYLLHGNMLCGVVEQRLRARVGPDQYESNTKKMGRSMYFVGQNTPKKINFYLDPSKGPNYLGNP